jgi:chromosome segregation ATPase
MSSISPDLINNLQSTEEYKRSIAISDSIKFLLGKIEELTQMNSKLTKQNNEINLSLKNSNETIFKLQTDNGLLQNEAKLYKSKLSITEQLNNTLEETIKELNLKIGNQNQNFNIKCEQFNNILNEYKNIFEELKLEKLAIENKFKDAINKINDYKEINQSLQIEINKLKSDKIALDILNNKLKSYEVLMYKLDLENQSFKQDIVNYRNQIASITNSQSFDDNYPIKKINLNNEIDNIDKNYQTIQVSTSQNLFAEKDNFDDKV